MNSADPAVPDVITHGCDKITTMYTDSPGWRENGRCAHQRSGLFEEKWRLAMHAWLGRTGHLVLGREARVMAEYGTTERKQCKSARSEGKAVEQAFERRIRSIRNLR